MGLKGIRVIHTKWGEGVIADCDEWSVSVQFEDCTRSLIFPAVFLDYLSVKDPADQAAVDAAIEKRNADKAAAAPPAPVTTAAPVKPTPSVRKRKTSKKPATVVPKHAIEQDFETYLKLTGYKEETPKGNHSTVYAYTKRVAEVIEAEGLSWPALVSQITSVIALYDVGGKKEHIGSKSNSTVINALRRFEDFVNHSGLSSGSTTP